MKILGIIHGNRKLNSLHGSFFEACKADPSLEVSLKKTEFSGHAKSMACEGKFLYEMIIIHGGDGLINEVVNGLCSVPGKNPKIFLLPGGTGNDFIRNFKPDKYDLSSFTQKLRQPGTIIPVPYCKTELELRYFMNIADFGFGGHVVHSLDYFRQRFGTKASYFLAVIKSFLSYKAPEFTLKFNESTHKKHFFMVAICHGSVFGDGMIIAPGNDPQQANFQLVVLGNVSLWDYIKNLPKLRKGLRIKHPEIHYHNTQEVQLDSTTAFVNGETDGEFIQGKQIQLGFSEHKIEVCC
jgi:YegS/Rv2252/BmrU family lipid kinase